MRILLLANRIPYPLDNGEDLRVFYFAKWLSTRSEIHLIAYGDDESPNKEVAALFKKVHVLKQSVRPGQNRISVSRVMQSLSPEHMYDFDLRIAEMLHNVTTAQRFDFAWVPAWSMMRYIGYINETRTILDVMDDGVLELVRDVKSTRSLARLIFILKRLFVTGLFERKYLRRGALCVFVAEKDAAVFRKLCPRTKTAVIPNGVDTDYYRPLGLPEEFPSVVFEGNMAFPPNVDAAAYFCRRILPEIHREIPEMRVYIVGKNPAAEVAALANPSITVTGYLDDIRPFLDRASVFVCPMRKGAGIKNKILQAWAMAKPVVATSIALGGLHAADGENILVADDPVSFARKTVSLLRDKRMKQLLGQRGRNTVIHFHSWQGQVQLLEERLREI